MKKGIPLLLAVVFFVSSCGYHFVGSYSKLAGSISKIYVDNVKNLTDEPNLQLYLKSDLINVLNLDSNVKVVDKPNANGYLYVSITSYHVSPSAFKANGLASMYRCTITASISLKGKSGYIMKNKKLTAYHDYDAQDDVSATEMARSSISKDVLKDLATQIDNELFVNF